MSYSFWEQTNKPPAKFSDEQLIEFLKKTFLDYDFKPHRSRWWDFWNWGRNYCCGVSMQKFDASSGIKDKGMKGVACGYCGRTRQVILASDMADGYL